MFFLPVFDGSYSFCRWKSKRVAGIDMGRRAIAVDQSRVSLFADEARICSRSSSDFEVDFTLITFRVGNHD